jgi:hypothetical protein
MYHLQLLGRRYRSPRQEIQVPYLDLSRGYILDLVAGSFANSNCETKPESWACIIRVPKMRSAVPSA